MRCSLFKPRMSTDHQHSPQDPQGCKFQKRGVTTLGSLTLIIPSSKSSMHKPVPDSDKGFCISVLILYAQSYNGTGSAIRETEAQNSQKTCPRSEHLSPKETTLARALLGGTVPPAPRLRERGELLAFCSGGRGNAKNTWHLGVWDPPTYKMCT